MNEPARDDRQARHRRLVGYGDPAVRRAADACVVVVGAGGLGSPALRVLAAAGIGALTVIDDDTIAESNLARQTNYTAADLGRGKAEVTVEALAPLAPDADLRGIATRLTADNARQLLGCADLVIDTSDDWLTRFAVAAACRELAVPLVWGSVLGWDGLATTFLPGGPSFDDLFDPATAGGATADCASAGVYAPMCAEVGAALAGEALRLAAGLAPGLVGRVRLWNARTGSVRDMPLRRQDAAGTPEPEDVDRMLSSANLRRMDECGEPLRPTGVPRVTLDDLPADAVVVDVRPAAHPPLPNPAHPVTRLPLEAIANETDPRLDELLARQAPLVVACSTGFRARHALELLIEAGARAFVLDGGIAALVGDAPHPDPLDERSPA